jgi:hypothetical protein
MDKSWVLGVQIDGASKAYDWIWLKESGILNDQLGDTPIVIVIASDGQSFAAFKRENTNQFTLRNDSLIGTDKTYDMLGKSRDGSQLERIKAYQEFWHSWKQFHPDTEVYR